MAGGWEGTGGAGSDSLEYWRLLKSSKTQLIPNTVFSGNPQLTFCIPFVLQLILTTRMSQDFLSLHLTTWPQHCLVTMRQREPRLKPQSLWFLEGWVHSASSVSFTLLVENFWFNSYWASAMTCVCSELPGVLVPHTPKSLGLIWGFFCWLFLLFVIASVPGGGCGDVNTSAVPASRLAGHADRGAVLCPCALPLGLFKDLGLTVQPWYSCLLNWLPQRSVYLIQGW